MKKRQSLWQVVLGKLESHIQINDFRILPYTIYKNKLKMFQRLNIRPKTPRKNIGKIIFDINGSNDFQRQKKKKKPK